MNLQSKRVLHSSPSLAAFTLASGRLGGLILFLLIAPCACDHPAAPTVTMQIGRESFALELATTEAEQELGLMHRDHLDSDKGMIFIFPDVAIRTFWNHDVSFPLDLIFLDAGGRIVSIKQMQQFSDLDVSSDAAAKYAIELNAGTAAGVGVKTGDTLSIPNQVAALSGR
ncbi:MAG: DUF192 domain-containing protein [Tepidisphaeraceae bacterium]|jgi:uncharacterized membrane protein (UPF0127 family)